MMNALKGINWQDARRKAWLLGLMIATAYAQTDPRFAPLLPVLTGIAGVSQPPVSAPADVAKVLVAGALVGCGVAWLG
jgi:hypothetical protein